jgi:hypothetical protein
MLANNLNAALSMFQNVKTCQGMTDMQRWAQEKKTYNKN